MKIKCIGALNAELGLPRYSVSHDDILALTEKKLIFII